MLKGTSQMLMPNADGQNLGKMQIWIHRGSDSKIMHF